MPKKLTNPNYKLSYSKVVNYILDSREQRMLKANPHSTSIQKSKKYEYETALNIIILYALLIYLPISSLAFCYLKGKT